MLKCCRCGRTYSEWETESRPAELGDGLPPWSRVAVCPYCGSDDNEECDMSVDLWAWTEECDRRVCVGDCDLCDVAVTEDEEEEQE